MNGWIFMTGYLQGVFPPNRKRKSSTHSRLCFHLGCRSTHISLSRSFYLLIIWRQVLVFFFFFFSLPLLFVSTFDTHWGLVHVRKRGKRCSATASILSLSRLNWSNGRAFHIKPFLFSLSLFSHTFLSRDAFALKDYPSTVCPMTWLTYDDLM